MTDLSKLRDDVIEAAKAAHGEPLPGMNHRVLRDAVTALRAAEEAEKRPRLRDAREVAREYLPRAGDLLDGCAQVIRGRDAEWMAGISKLEAFTHHRQHGDGVFTAMTVVNRADIEALAESAK